MSRKKTRPADPQAIMQAAAIARRAERDRLRDPANWGVSPDTWRTPPELLDLTPANDVDVVIGARRQVIHARRMSDAFSILHKARGEGGKPGLSDEQHQASERYWRDWAQRVGVSGIDNFDLDPTKGGGGGGLNQSMLDAAKRIDAAHREIGRRDAALLKALVEPLVGYGEVRIWRVLVQQVTGETARDAQAAAVRAACENLRQAYDHLDAEAARKRARPLPAPFVIADALA